MTHLAVHQLATISIEDRRRIMERATAEIFDPTLVSQVGELVADVRARGDAALVDALARFDSVTCNAGELRVQPEEFDVARAAVADDLLDAIRLGIRNIRAFNEKIADHATWRSEIAPGHLVGEQAGPIDAAGLFVPSGKGSFPSVLMQIGTPAIVAGVPSLVVIVPPGEGGIAVDPAVLVVAEELGLDHVVRSNGPAGIAAVAFGTETVPRVSRVVGPGSPAVTAAQIAVQAAGCSTVMLFGPTEAVVIADDSADPETVAADVLNEAEHGNDSAALLVTTSSALVAAVDQAIGRQLRELPDWRRAYAETAISHFGGAVIVETLDEAAAFVSEYAPEHLQIATEDPEALVASICHAGEILLGDTPFSAANYVIGVPATLPTGGFARQASGVNYRTFVKTSSIAQTSGEALGALAPFIRSLAVHEGFPAHEGALRVRGY